MSKFIGVPPKVSITSGKGVWGMNSVIEQRYNNTWPRTFAGKTNKFADLFNPLDINTWTASATKVNCTVISDTSTTTPYGGVPIKMTTTGVADPLIETRSSAAFNIAAAAAGQTWEARVLAKSDIPLTALDFFIFGSTAAGATVTIASTQYNTTTSWGEYTFQHTLVGATITNIQCRLDGPGAGTIGNIWFDGFQLYRIV
jgi:hypothetical protein